MKTGSVADRPLWILEPGPDLLGGGWIFALRVAENIGRDVTIACPVGSPVHRAASGAGIPVCDISFPTPALARIPALFACAAALRRSIPADAIVVSGAIRASLATSIAMLANPVVHLMHERDSAGRASVRLALRRSRAVVAVGVGAAAAYQRALPHADVAAVNNFLATKELEQFAAAQRERAHGEHAGAPGLGVVARLVREKGVDVLVDELAAIPDSWSRLLVAGERQDEWYAREIEARIARHGLGDRIILLGERSDIPAVLAQIDVLVVPSTGNEGQPTVILEGLAAGLPVIARTEVIGEEFNGFPVVAFNGSKELADALRELPRTSADLGLFVRRFGVDQVIEQLDAAATRAIRPWRPGLRRG